MSDDALDAKLLTPTRVGLSLSIAVLGIFSLMALQSRCELLPSETLECRSNLAWFLDSRPNEIGDTLAGFAGTLAFIWIVVTVWLQSVELREQREVLKAQRKEFEEMAAAQKAQVHALNEQAEVFKAEQLSRYQEEKRRLLDELLQSLRRQLLMIALQEWKITGPHPLFPEDALEMSVNLIQIKPGETIDEIWLEGAPLRIRPNLMKLREKIKASTQLSEPLTLVEIEMAVLVLERAIEIFSDLSDAQRVRVERLDLVNTHHLLKSVLKDKNFFFPITSGDARK